MHALAAHGYHLLLRAAHVAAWPLWRSLLAVLAVALAARALRRPRMAALGGALAVLVGWAVLSPLTTWPLLPVQRLPGLAAIILGQAVLLPRVRASWAAAATSTAVLAWWLCGAPLGWAALSDGLPVFLGLLAALLAASKLARGDAGWATLAGAIALAASLRVSGAAPHWALAALAPATAAAALLGVAEATPVLAGTIVCLAVAALVASDRGRVYSVDVACSTPLLVWAAAGLTARQNNVRRSATASAFAALSCVLLAWIAGRF